MKIHGIYPKLNNNVQNSNVKDSKVTNTTPVNSSQNFELRDMYNDRLMSFGAIRVDKGLKRFYAVNKDRMPETVKRFVARLKPEEDLTPLEVHARAFADLDLATTVDDVKRLFPEELKFQGLINPEDSKARRGILGVFGKNKELFELCEQGILEDGQNLTVYLLKKIYKEGKTIDEINKGLEKDLDKDFLKIFREQNPDSPFVYSSTVKALGIEAPDFEYQQSLRFTREGYSDMMGEKISKAQIELWNSLSPEQRATHGGHNAIASFKKSVSGFEEWWTGLSVSEKLDKLAEQDNELAMLQEYKDARKLERKPRSKSKEEGGIKTPHNHVGSETLKKDELFILWAKKNLQIYEAGLTEAEKKELHIRRVRNMSNRWAEMTPAQRTEYISKMQSGLEPLKYTMIDAWNNCTDIIIDLSEHLKQNKIARPAEFIYSTETFSEHQSKIMSEFWEKHPQHSEKLGKQIQLSHQKVKIAIENGTFNDLKQTIAQGKAKRRREIEAYMHKKALAEQEAIIKAEQAKAAEALKKDYKADFKDAFFSNTLGNIKNLPDKYFDDAYGRILETMPEDLVKLWTRNLRGEALHPQNIEKLQKYLSNETHEIARANRALEATFADVLRNHTDSPELFELYSSDLRTIMYHFEAKDEGASIISHRNDNQAYNLTFQNLGKKISKSEVNSLYEQYKQDLPYSHLRSIVRQYFTADYEKALELGKSEDGALALIEEKQNKLVDYLSTYGKSALLVFSNERGLTTAQKNSMNTKIIFGLPKDIMEGGIIRPVLWNEHSFAVENSIQKARNAFARRYPFMPSNVMTPYFDEFAINMRRSQSTEYVEMFIEQACKRGTSAEMRGRTTCIEKTNIMPETKMKMLAMEQAMADVLYESSGNEKVYGMEFELLMDKLEIFSLIKKYPADTVPTLGADNEVFIMSAKKRPNFFKLDKLYKEYLAELAERTNSSVRQSGDVDKLEFIYALNPEEGHALRDYLVAKRMERYGFKLSEEDFPKLPD